ncbi:hypothetical protein [Lentzea sp. NPDC004782]|uniref:hypothetical protein n=1 Tax=Lentzea sp. NPDC004782 TaxID=3154458 RepID=UPI0033B007C8
MRTKFSALPALLVTTLFVLPPAFTPRNEGFDVNVYNGTGRWMMVSEVGHDQAPGGNWRRLRPGRWSRSYTGIDDVDQLQVPGCGLLSQGRWYPAGTWAHVHGWTPVVYVCSVTC